MKSTTILDKDRIVEAAVAGESNKRIAQRYGCTLYDVRTALDEFAAEQLRPSSRAAALALEVNRLDKLRSVFLREAIESRDAAAGTLCCKLSQRKAALLGLDQPQVVPMDMSVVVESHQETSTEHSDASFGNCGTPVSCIHVRLRTARTTRLPPTSRIRNNYARCSRAPTH